MFGLGAVGLIVGLRRPEVGVAATIGLVALMIAAVTYHLRADDRAGPARPVALGLLAAAALYTARGALRRPGRTSAAVN